MTIDTPTQLPGQHPAQSGPAGSVMSLAWRLLFYMAVIAVLLASLCMFGGAMLDHAVTPDLPWLLGTGRYILEHGQLPRHDIFSWTHPDKPWVLYQWLFEVFVAQAWQWLGDQTVVRVFMVVIASLYLLGPFLGVVSRRIPTAFHLLVGCLALLTITVNMSLRPMVVTTIFLGAQYLLLHHLRRGRLGIRPVLSATAVMYLFWGNSHTGVVLGLVSLGLMALGDILEQRGWYPFTPAAADAEGPPLPLRQYGWLLATGFVASLVNPYGLGIYHYLADLSSQQYMNNIIVELQSPNFHWLAYQFFTLLLVLFILLMPWARQVFPARDLLHLLVFTLAMLFVQRFVVWTCLFYVLVMPKALYHWYQALGHRKPAFVCWAVENIERLRPVLLGIMVILAVVFLVHPAPFPKARHGKCESLHKGITAYHRLKLPSDRVFHDPVTGSCTLLYSPQDKVFIDTRFDFYGSAFMAGHRGAMYLMFKGLDFLKEWQADTFVIQTGLPLARYLGESPGYRKVYADNHLVVYRRTSR